MYKLKPEPQFKKKIIANLKRVHPELINDLMQAFRTASNKWYR